MTEKKTKELSKEVSFEEALARLEALVEAMEGGELSLEAMIAHYKEGTGLVQFCAARLEAAQKEIEIITRNAAGQPEAVLFQPQRTEPGRQPAPAAAEAAPAPKPRPRSRDGEDVRLF